jgi:hypothetical protein
MRFLTPKTDFAFSRIFGSAGSPESASPNGWRSPSPPADAPAVAGGAAFVHQPVDA